MDASSRSDQEKSLLDSLKLYAQKKHYYDLEAILLSEDCSQHYAVSVHATSLIDFSIEFAISLFKTPEDALKTLSHAFKKTAINILDEHSSRNDMTMKENIHVRLIALPSSPEIYRTVLPKCSDVGQFLCITGTVVRVTVAKVLEYRKLWRCSKCKYQFQVDVTTEEDFSHVKPSRCANPDLCYNKNFTIVSNDVNPAWCEDYQEIRVQEQVHNLVVGTIPRSMWIILKNDLVDSCQPGNDVVISGIICTRWKPFVEGVKIDIELILVAHNVEVKSNSTSLGVVSEDSLKDFQIFWQNHQTNPLQARDFILSCFCPQVFGLYIVKLSVAIILAGGVQRVDNSNNKIRGDSHLLLVGDPGTGKSQFLKYASKISRRSVLTSGVGTTNAGLTCAAVKDGGKWQLEAGALVLADGGICCIDEFSSIKEQDKASIHEAMEQQTISVAKAGLVSKLNTQCSILAATNPKGKYDKNESLSSNTAMASPLLSRFDIILVLLDTYNEKWDELVSSYILEGKDVSLEYGGQACWSMEKMRDYFSVIKNIVPKMNSDCDRILQAYYKKQRSMVDRSAARTTPRLLQSLVRLAQGHARLMFRAEVLAVDAIAAISVMESSMQGFGLFTDNNALHTTFPDDPYANYINQATSVLKSLELYDLLEKEMSVSSSASQGAAITQIRTQMDPYHCENEDEENLVILSNVTRKSRQFVNKQAKNVNSIQTAQSQSPVSNHFKMKHTLKEREPQDSHTTSDLYVTDFYTQKRQGDKRHSSPLGNKSQSKRKNTIPSIIQDSFDCETNTLELQLGNQSPPETVHLTSVRDDSKIQNLAHSSRNMLNEQATHTGAEVLETQINHRKPKTIGNHYMPHQSDVSSLAPYMEKLQGIFSRFKFNSLSNSGTIEDDAVQKSPSSSELQNFYDQEKNCENINNNKLFDDSPAANIEEDMEIQFNIDSDSESLHGLQTQSKREYFKCRSEEEQLFNNAPNKIVSTLGRKFRSSDPNLTKDLAVASKANQSKFYTQQNETHLSNNVTTLSELNAVFSTDFAPGFSKLGNFNLKTRNRVNDPEKICNNGEVSGMFSTQLNDTVKFQTALPKNAKKLMNCHDNSNKSSQFDLDSLMDMDLNFDL